MMIGQPTRAHPTVQIPPWDHHFEDQTANIGSPFSVAGFNGNAASPGNSDFSPYITEALAALQRYLPSNEFAGDSDFAGDDFDLPFDSFACDNFRMYEFKIRRCARGRSHDWTECPYAHPGEKARRRDPRKFGYSGTACPEFRKGSCKKGDLCEFSHGVFECWLHPDRYRTQPCKDGTNCRRRICFFAHAPEQLRILTQQSPRNHHVDGSPTIRRSLDSYLSNNGSFGSSHASYLLSPPGSPPSDSPPMSPNSPSYGTSFNSMSELVSNMRNMQVNGKVISPPSRGIASFGLNRCSNLRPGPDFSSSPTTSSPAIPRSGHNAFDLWETKTFEEEPVMERVESGRDLRAKIYAKLSKENSLGLIDSNGGAPDFGWVSELVK